MKNENVYYLKYMGHLQYYSIDEASVDAHNKKFGGVYQKGCLSLEGLVRYFVEED